MDIKTMGGSRQGLNGAAPEISIIIVTLNAGSFLENCLNSIIGQPYQGLEIIVFDGGSKDGTIDILGQYEKFISYWQSGPDNGIYDAMNKAVLFARGQWFYFLGADDRLLPGFSELAHELTDLNTVYYGDMSYNGQPTSRKEYTSYRLAKETICHQAIFYPRTVFDHYRYNIQYPLAADWALNLQLWGDKRFKFQFFPYVVADFSMTGASTLTKDDRFLRDQPELIRTWLGGWVYLRFLVKKYKDRLRGIKQLPG